MHQTLLLDKSLDAQGRPAEGGEGSSARGTSLFFITVKDMH